MLTFRWDESKGVHRESRAALDGDDRVRFLMRAAFEMTDSFATTSQLEATARNYLALLQYPQTAAGGMLREVAQWYGILIPVSEQRWAFAHRSFHDYLAARYWVE